MKNQNILPILCFFCLFITSANAQYENWAVEGSNWIYHTTNFGSYNESGGHFSIGQEMKAGKLCQKITKNNGYLYVYEDNNDIFMWYDKSNRFVQIYDWDAIEGDSYDCSRADFSGEEVSQTCVIENIDTILIDDMAYQKQTIVVHNNEDSTILCPWTKVIVGIGGTEYFGVPLALNLPSAEQWTYLICHTNPQGNTSTITEIEGAETCTFLVETEKIDTPSFTPRLSPNPMQDQLLIEWNESLSQNATIFMHNTLGQQVANQPLQTGITSIYIAVHHLPKGTYIATMHMNQQTYLLGKIVKE